MEFEYSTNDRVKSISKMDIHEYLGSILGTDFFEYRKQWDYFNKTKEVSDFPLYLVLEQMYKCNLKCSMCIMSYPEKKKYDPKASFMSDELFLKIMKEAQKNNCKSISLNNSEEPLLSKKVIERIKLAREHGFIDIFMNTNATLLTPEISKELINSGLTRLLIGFDGYTKETYEKIRVGANFEKVKRNIETFLELRERASAQLPIVRMSFVINEENRNEVDPFKKTWKDKVDYLAMQEYVPPPAEDLKLNPEDKILDKYECDQPFNRLTIRSDGSVLPCCSFHGYNLKLGNINEMSIKDIWHSDKLNRVRSSFINNKPNKVCIKCLNGS